MKTTTKRILLVGVALLVVGALIALAALASMHFDFRRLSTRQTVTNTYAPTGDFRDILLSLNTEKLSFLPSEDGKLRVVCVEEEGLQHVVTVSDGVLGIQSVDTRKWHEHIGFNLGETSVTVYLPNKDYGALTLGTDTGDVTLPADFRFESVLMTASTGDLDLRADVEGSVSIRTSTGDIRLDGLQADSLDLQASTGHIRVSGCEIAGSVKVQTSTGEASFTDLSCADAQVTTTTGEVDLVRVLASESFRIETDTGDVRFDRSDAPEIRVETDTGDVTGTLLTPKTFEYDTDTGKVRLPRSEPGGRCELKSDTGDFDIGIAG